MELKDIIKDDWKVIDDFPRYLISNRGEVFSITSNKVLRVGINKGYAKVVLCNSATGNNKTIEVHRLVAKAFVNNPNPNEFVQVNHKDENTLNNNANNLEWCTAKYNSNYGNRNKKLANYFAPIVQVDCFNNRLRIFKTINVLLITVIVHIAQYLNVVLVVIVLVQDINGNLLLLLKLLN